ncbi:MAG: methylated-DNA--[protein]-cysteine S-methyltransferase [Alphaproteobacteria bacterium]|nr:methylated-DNA--[protein]-cysteine S-methyltransferase [Alphaproteobacteria bacterium]
MFQQTHHTPFGWVTVHSNGEAVTCLDFALDGSDDDSRADDVSRETWRQINAYCAGERRDFDLPLVPDASPALTRWLTTMRKINYGKTITYKDFARLADAPQAPRAAGSACARNPIPLIIPCHRVTRHDGSLGNFGALRALSPKDPRNLDLKQALIDHEARFSA